MAELILQQIQIEISERREPQLKEKSKSIERGFGLFYLITY